MSKKIILILIFFTTAFGVALWFWNKPLFYASALDNYSLLQSEVISLKSYRNPVELRILSSNKIKQNDFQLEIVPSIGKIRRISLPGFEQDCVFIDQQSYEDGDLLFFKGPVGVHSENLTVVSLNQEKMRVVKFKTPSSEDISLQSDWPDIKIVNDAELDIEAVYRDYEKDPLVQGYTRKYRFDNNDFIINSN